MRAAQLQAVGKFAIVDTVKPVPNSVDALIAVQRVALCRTDAKMWRMGQRDLVTPRILGHEIAGIEVATGRRVAIWPGHACGVCKFCCAGMENLCRSMKVLGFHADGGLAEFVIAPQKSLLEIPQHLEDDLACLAEPLGCCECALDQAGVGAGMKVLILGAGPVGLLMALAVANRQAQPVVTDTVSSRLTNVADFLQKIGGSSVSLTAIETGSYAVAVNAAPATATMVSGITALAPGGAFSLFSGLVDSESLPTEVLNRIHYYQLRVSGAYGCTRKQMQKSLTVLADNQLAARMLILKTIGLDEIPAAFEHILDGGALRYVVDPTSQKKDIS